MNINHKLPFIQTADRLNMSDDTLEALVIVCINNHTHNKVNTLITQIYSLEIGSVPSPAKGRHQAAPGGARRRQAAPGGANFFSLFFLAKAVILKYERHWVWVGSNANGHSAQIAIHSDR